MFQVSSASLTRIVVVYAFGFKHLDMHPYVYMHEYLHILYYIIYIYIYIHIYICAHKYK